MLRHALRFSHSHRVLHPIGRMSARCALHHSPQSVHEEPADCPDCPHGLPGAVYGREDFSCYNAPSYDVLNNTLEVEEVHVARVVTTAENKKRLCPNKVVRWLDITGTALFASSGCLTAGAAGLDMYGCVVVGAITGLGGGTIRDMILGGNNNTENGSTAVFWINEPEYLKLALGVAFGTFLAWQCWDFSHPESILQDNQISQVLFLMDSVGLGVFAIIGVNNAIRLNLTFLPAMLCAALTSTGGGMVRDVLCQKPVRVLTPHEESYVTAPLLSAAVYQLIPGAPLGLRLAAGVGSCVAMRLFSTQTGFRLPTLPGPRQEAASA